MKNITFTYDTVRNGEHGEACLTLPMFEDDRALQIQRVATANPVTLGTGDFSLYYSIHELLYYAEAMRGRVYTHDSIKTVELEDVKA